LSDHHPYSPDLALSHYPPFAYLNNRLWSKHFNNTEEFMEAVKIQLSSQKNLLHDNKCLNSSGDYVHKWLKYVCTFCTY
jgi:hypothetical protein